jgi:hypothetical protein
MMERGTFGFIDDAISFAEVERFLVPPPPTSR